MISTVNDENGTESAPSAQLSAILDTNESRQSTERRSSQQHSIEDSNINAPQLSARWKFRNVQRSPSVSSHISQGLDEGQNAHIHRFFAPTIAVHASTRLEQFLASKGCRKGLASLLRPLGENVSGKVVVRDSTGCSRTWHDFGVFFDKARLFWGQDDAQDDDVQLATKTKREDRELETLQQLLSSWVQRGECPSFAAQELHNPSSAEALTTQDDFFAAALRVLLPSSSLSPFEVFRHPVTCLIAISSKEATPIETLRELYANTTRSNSTFPHWISPDFLRYYVLVHDEDEDDIVESMSLFEQMKRHFGLHCHLLRLRGVECVCSDEGSALVPECEWRSAHEELRRSNIQSTMQEADLYIHESDLLSINNLVREMVVQSVIPFMESRIALWNEQVAAKKRGFSGRFLSLSKRLTGLAGSKNSGISTPGTNGSNYDQQVGIYPSESPEFTMLQLAEYALMLRDYKLASQTFDAVRADFAQDKAWTYHAAANEMAALTTLLAGSSAPKPLLGMLDQYVEAALYSYTNRSGMPLQAVRCLLLILELCKTNGSQVVELGLRWAYRALDLSLLGSYIQALVAERIIDLHTLKVDENKQPSHTRLADLWRMVAAKKWAELGCLQRMSACLAPLRLKASQWSDNLRPWWDEMQIIAKPGEAGVSDLMGSLSVKSNAEVMTDDRVRHDRKQSEAYKEGTVVQVDGFA